MLNTHYLYNKVLYKEEWYGKTKLCGTRRCSLSWCLLRMCQV